MNVDLNSRPDIEQRLHELFAQCSRHFGKVQILLELRREFQLSFPDATGIVRQFESLHPNATPVDPASISGCIYALGPFSADLVELLDYAPDFYDKVAPGAPVIVLAAEVFKDTNACTAMAAAFGISDPCDFNQHAIDPARIDLKKLAEALKSMEYDNDEIDFQVDKIGALVKADFRFIFYLTDIGGTANELEC